MRTCMRLLIAIAVSALMGTHVVVAHDAEAAADATSSEEAMPLPDGGLLQPGTYLVPEYDPAMELTVADGWNVVGLYGLDGHGFDLGWGGTGRQILRLGLFFDGKVHTQPCYVPDEQLEGDLADIETFAWLVQPDNLTTTDATVEGFWAHLDADPYLEIDQLVEVQVSGFEGLQAGVRASVPEECVGQDTFLWRTRLADEQGVR